MLQCLPDSSDYFPRDLSVYDNDSAFVLQQTDIPNIRDTLYDRPEWAPPQPLTWLRLPSVVAEVDSLRRRSSTMSSEAAEAETEDAVVAAPPPPPKADGVSLFSTVTLSSCKMNPQRWIGEWKKNERWMSALWISDGSRHNQGPYESDTHCIINI